MRRFLVTFEIPDCFYTVERPHSDRIGRFEGVFMDTAEPITVALTDFREEVGGAPIHIGIAADVQVSADDIQGAISLATQRLEGVLQIAALQSNAAVGNPRLRIAIERTPGSPTTEMVQVEDRYDDVFTKKRGLDVVAVERLGQAFHQQGTARISRALYWYRKGLNERDPIDQFSSFWLGLEALNGPLMDSLGESPEMRACKSCGAVEEVPTSKGIRALFEAHSPNGLNDFRLCRRLRVNIQHSTSDLSEVYKVSPDAAEMARRMLRVAIYILLGMPAEEGLTAQSAIYNNQGLHAEYQLRYHIPTDAWGQEDMSPIVDTSESTIEVTQDGEQGHVKWTPRLKFGVSGEVDIQMLARTHAGKWSEVPQDNDDGTSSS